MLDCMTNARTAGGAILVRAVTPKAADLREALLLAGGPGSSVLQPTRRF
jgi:hypothetical protein